MSKDIHQPYYHTNQKYTNFLDGQNKKDFEKFADLIVKYTEKDGEEQKKYLEVGCGTGITLELLTQKSKLDLSAVEISKTSAEISQNKGFNVVIYDGYKLPFADNSFDAVGSINVLEHTDDTKGFLDEIFRVMKPGAVFVLACPNFLSITNNYHANTRGFGQKVKNLNQIISRLLSKEYQFEKMATTEREDFQADDDACVVTNPIDIKKWAKSHDMTELYWSSKTTYSSRLAANLDVSFLRYFFGSSVLVFKKSK